MIRASFCSSVLAALLLATTGRAQPSALKVQAVQADGSPIAGALIGIVSSDGSVVAEGITDSRGFRTLTAAPGKYRVRLRRIGFQPFLSTEVIVPRNDVFKIIADTRRVQLQSVVVTSRTACRQTSGQNGIATLWDEITKALEGSRLTRADLTNAGVSLRYNKQVTMGGEIRFADSARTTIAGARPFSAINPTFLATQGYVIGDEMRGWDYFGPDEGVLLSNAFVDTHCFRVIRDRKRAGQIGLTFEPSPRHRIADIAGTLWLNEKNAELVQIDFHYVNVGILSRFKPGGEVHFRRMSSGAWLVDRWFLRFPLLEKRVDLEEPLAQVGYAEQGGFILSDVPQQVANGIMRTLRGEIFDSVTSEPLRGAVVTIDSSRAITRNDGSFEFTAVPSGLQTISFTHPSLQSFGFAAIERTIDIASDSMYVRLGTPSLSTVWLKVCRDAKPDVPVQERGIVHGYVHDDSGQAVAYATVEFRWLAYTPTFGERSNVPRRSLIVLTDPQGHYVACGFRRLSVGDVVARKGDLKSQSVGFEFDRTLFVRRDLVLR